jgi:hypothetical protein
MEIMLERVAGTEDNSSHTVPVDMTATSDGVRRCRKCAAGAIWGQHALMGLAAVQKAAQEYFLCEGLHRKSYAPILCSYPMLCLCSRETGGPRLMLQDYVDQKSEEKHRLDPSQDDQKSQIKTNSVWI